MLRLAKEHGALVQTGHVERFNRAIRAALPYVHAPLFIESNRLATFNPRGADVAVVLDLMIHDIDLVHTLVRSKAASVVAVGVPVITPFVDMANARLAFDSGAVANITASRMSRDRMRKIRIFQKSGYISLDLAAGTGEYLRLRQDVNLAELATAPIALEQVVERIPLEAEEGEPLRLEFESFLAAVRGEAPIAVTGEEGREALAVALRIERDITQSLRALDQSKPQPARA
jgi:predicted dehydrogenase